MTRDPKEVLNLDKSRAESFVVSLFHIVLSRKQIAKSEIDYWTEYLVEHQDPIGVFDLFKNSVEYSTHQSAYSRSETMYPHGHFYSPVCDKKELRDDIDRIYNRRTLRAVHLNVGRQSELLKCIAPHFDAMPFSDGPSDSRRYHYENTSYGFGDACIYWGIIKHFKPKRIIEVGSGFTSALALDAAGDGGEEVFCTFIDPYPDLARSLVGESTGTHEIIERRVQDVPLEKFEELHSGDILFIDSSHVAKTGSDVNYEILEILPVINSGVIVHFHDVFFPFEYPRQWTVEDNKSWNELYMIQAFLMYNKEFEVLYFNDYFARENSAALLQIAPKQGARMLLNPGGGLWITKR